MPEITDDDLRRLRSLLQEISSDAAILSGALTARRKPDERLETSKITRGRLWDCCRLPSFGNRQHVLLATTYPRVKQFTGATSRSSHPSGCVWRRIERRCCAPQHRANHIGPTGPARRG